jgi:threonine dehydrogenase-like Zn-dependent dehydrogenase
VIESSRWYSDPMITGTVDLHGVDKAFELFASAEEHAKILVNPAIQSAVLTMTR